MAERYFSADFHFNSTCQIKEKYRPFRSVESMNKTIIHNCNQVFDNNPKNGGNVLIHLGDFIQRGNDREYKGVKVNPCEFINQLHAQFVNIEGNHDNNNKVVSAGDLMYTQIGEFYVSMGHLPSYLHPNVERLQHIHLCGHVHNEWRQYYGGDGRHHYDKEHNIHNFNVGIDVWGFAPVSEGKLLNYIRKVLKYHR